jgi:hypothetical protein
MRADDAEGSKCTSATCCTRVTAGDGLKTSGWTTSRAANGMGSTRTSLIQWFGEVASANGIPPKTQMGKCQFPSSTNASDMATRCDLDAKAWVCWYRDQQSASRTVAKYYDITRVAFGETRYGGTGQ